MTISQDSEGKQSIKMTLPTLGAVSSILSVIIFCVGWLFGYLTFKADMKVVTDNVIDLRANTRLAEQHREEDARRLTNLEADIKYISQGIAEMKLSLGTLRK
jgi:hypothetical protein